MYRYMNRHVSLCIVIYEFIYIVFLISGHASTQFTQTSFAKWFIASTALLLRHFR